MMPFGSEAIELYCAKSRKMKKNMTFFLKNLAIFDLIELHLS